MRKHPRVATRHAALGLAEHIGHDTNGLDGRAACRLFAEVARNDAERRRAVAPLEGLALAIAATYTLPK